MKKSVIYIYPQYASFIQKDLDFLSKKYDVKIPKHDWDNKLILLNFFRQFYFLIKYIPSCQVAFVMFGGYWSFLPVLFGKIFNKPVYIILGGTDCVSFPSINYGSLRKPLLRSFIKWSIQLSKKLLPVDESLAYNDYQYFEKCDYKNQGFKFFFPQVSTPYQVIHNGFNPAYFREETNDKIPNSFITLASVKSMKRFKLKGIDLVLQLAGIHQECTFIVIGISKKVIDRLDLIPENVTFLPFLNPDQFKPYLLTSEFVLHLSISEGFPNSLCEAMLCKCIPIASSVGAIPNIINDVGYLITSSNFQFIEGQFNNIINTTKSHRKELALKARNRIIEHFHISKREESFIELIEHNS